MPRERPREVKRVLSAPMAGCLGWRQLSFRGTEWDYRHYEGHAYEILASPRGRAAILEGGIVWRLALEILGDDARQRAAEGPSSDVLQFAQEVRLGQESYLDDALTAEEIDIICGTYKVADAGHVEPAHLSWWPRPMQWKTSGLNLGYWTQQAEQWFVTRIGNIRQGRAEPMSGKAWKSSIRIHSGAFKLRTVCDRESDKFLSDKLLPSTHGV
ncbi:hypothetical protein C8Q78DRAFT_984036 [Trametes maxima]|nr:hypothetical protein C8Q78DRAFT_984036 [Trametes maxima]